MVEIINGATNKPATRDLLKKFFKNHPEFDGILYIAYPILFSGERSITIDALWLSKQYGILIFDFIEKREEVRNYKERQNEIYSLLDSKLRGYPELRKNRRNFLVNIEIVSYAPNLSVEGDYLVTNDDQLMEFISDMDEWKHSELFDTVLSILQSVIKLKRKEKRIYVKRPNSRGAILKNLETTMAVLDRNQERAVIEYFEGIQRIRGLAGSGKTIVLALKAAYLHTQNPDWNIAVTFNTRSLKQQFRELITRFCIEKKGEEPDWDKLKIVNAWGSPRDKENERGIYYDFCLTNRIEYHDFNKARKIVGPNQTPFEAVCQKALSEIQNSCYEKYDAILVDEAQDLSESFLKLCYLFLKGDKKRLIYAYDELQKLNEGSPLRNPREFLIKENEIFDDQILRVCYRNPRPILVTAHALGFGIYRINRKGEKELVQFFDQPQLWRDLGYEVESGELSPGKEVVLYRPETTSPRYLEEHSPIEDLIIFKVFDNKKEQAKWIAEEIEKNLKKDELLFKDIIVINPIGLITKKEVSLVRIELLKRGINNHIAGEMDANIFFKENSICLTGINRAKGNEVPMIYLINAQDVYSGILGERDLIRRRNILFTAITRSKAWVRVVGIGENMQKLIQEYEEVKKNNFKLHFIYPDPGEIERLNLIHRDISDKELREQENEIESLERLLQIVRKIKDGEAYIEDYPEQYRHILKTLLHSSSHA